MVTRSFLSLALLLGCSLAPRAAWAQDGGNIDLNAFQPAMDSRGFVTVNASQVLGDREISFGMVGNWGRNVLRFENGQNLYVVHNLISPILIGAFGLHLGFLRLELGTSFPFKLMSGDRDPDDDGNTPANPNDDRSFRFDGQGLGDIGLHLKTRFYNSARGKRIGLALIGSVYFPTASEPDKWLGEGSVTPQIMAVVDRDYGADGRFRAALNGGFRFRSGDHSFVDNPMSPSGVPATNMRIVAGPIVPFGAGLAFALLPHRFEVIGEVFGAVPISSENYFPLEAIGGIKLYLAEKSFLSLGGGVGFLPGQGANPDVRAFLGIVFEPNIGDMDRDGIKDEKDQCPTDPEDYDDFADEDGCPEPDNDGDGIFDVDDDCPNEPEDFDEFEDEDGCPEVNQLDRDNDGIIDHDDDCPDEPEDIDGFQDQDGCPDLDNDGDGIADLDDLCPNDPEDKDKFEDQDGCPDPDNDGDRIADVDDKCPGVDGQPREETRETYNGVEDDDGCPDRGRVVVTSTKIDILDKIYFEFNRAVIKRESYPILDALAATLQANPDILLVEIQGHTDARGSDDYNLRLSDDRAAAVRQYLVDQGVAPGRLRSRGYGESQPVDRRQNESAWAKNRRVEFLILKRAKE